MQRETEGFESTSFSGDNEVYFIYHSKTFLDTVFNKYGFKVIEYHEQVFPQEGKDDLVDMVYLLRKG